MAARRRVTPRSIPAASTVRRNVRVALFDWELDAGAHRLRLERIVGPDMPDVRYVRCDRRSLAPRSPSRGHPFVASMYVVLNGPRCWPSWWRMRDSWRSVWQGTPSSCWCSIGRAVGGLEAQA